MENVEACACFYHRRIKFSKYKEWYDLGPSSSTWTCSKDSHLTVPRPFKRENAPLRELAPFGDDPNQIKIDIAHTYAIAGYGKDCQASTLIFLAVRCHVWGRARKYETQLEWAYNAFSAWCKAHQKTSSIQEFSKAELKITSLLTNTF